MKKISDNFLKSYNVLLNLKNEIKENNFSRFINHFSLYFSDGISIKINKLIIPDGIEIFLVSDDDKKSSETFKEFHNRTCKKLNNLNQVLKYMDDHKKDFIKSLQIKKDLLIVKKDFKNNNVKLYFNDDLRIIKINQYSIIYTDSGLNVNFSDDNNFINQILDQLLLNNSISFNNHLLYLTDYYFLY